MSTQIELYSGPTFPLFGTLPLASVLRPTLERMLGVDLPEANIRLELMEIVDEPAVKGCPVVYNLVPDFGYAYVSVGVGGRMIYRHPHPLSELIGQPLQQTLAAKYPDEAIWGFRIAVPQLARRIVLPAPSIEGTTVILPYEQGQGPAFGIRRLADPNPETATLSDFGVDARIPAKRAPVQVVIPAALHAELLVSRSLSLEVEEGGFLTGEVYRDSEAEGSFIVSVQSAPTAEQTGASLLHFTFTGDSFTAIKKSLREGQSGTRLLGWYHTHLFGATDKMGLSSIDVRLHLSTFTLPWQVAGLINIEGGQRVLRFYTRQGDTMALCPYWVRDEQR